MMIDWRDDHRDFVNECRVARLSTVDARGESFLVPICYALVGNMIVTPIDEKPKLADRRLKRVRNIEETARATLLFDHYEDADWSNLRWLMIRGSARIIDAGDDLHALAISILRKRYVQYGAMDLERAEMIVVTPEHASAWGFSAP